MADALETLRKKQKEEQVRAYLDSLVKRGAKISVEGYTLPFAQMVKVLSVCEGYCYMPDITAENSESGLEVRFDRVSLS